MSNDGRYLIPHGDDPLPLERMVARHRDNLCTICGVRIWSSDIPIHDAWHDRTDTPNPPT